MQSTEIAERFASALDRSDFEAASALLAPGCVYHLREVTLRGARTIIASYRQADQWARSTLDAVRYESSVRPEGAATAVITFVDHLEHAGRAHTHRCEQRLELDACGLVASITHIDLAGEREAVERFFAAVGMAPRPLGQADSA